MGEKRRGRFSALAGLGTQPFWGERTGAAQLLLPLPGSHPPSPHGHEMDSSIGGGAQRHQTRPSR